MIIYLEKQDILNIFAKTICTYLTKSKNEYIDTPPPFIRNYVPLNTLNLPERDSIQLSIKNVLEEYTRIQKYLPSILENTDLKKESINCSRTNRSR